MVYEKYTPPIGLQPYVEYFWSAKVVPDPNQNNLIHTMVDDSSGMIFHHSTESCSLAIDGNPVPTSMLYGQTTAPSYTQCLSPFMAVGVLFKPHAISELFGIDAFELTNQMVDLNEMGLSDLQEQINDAHYSLDHQLKLLTEFLLNQADKKNRRDEIIVYGLMHMKKSDGILTVRDLQDHLNISERQLERRFKTVIGVAPRHYLKVLRFQKAVETIRSGKVEKLSDMAYDLNYSDQSHLIRHCKELSGLSPKNLQKTLQPRPVNLVK
jgi:AraC-like DNA-binding protein